MSEKIEKSLKHLFASIKDDENAFYVNNVEELLKTAGKKKKPKKALYSAAFLTEGSREDLYNWWKMHVKEQPLDKVPKHSHMTIKFKPSHEDILALPIGESAERTVTVVGYCNNELGQAVQVRVSDEVFARQDDGIAHITISVSNDAPRGFAYSNQLLCEGIIEVKSGPELKVRIGMFMQNGEIKYDLEGTFYHTSTEESIEVTI
jgi:hypothetical protein